MNTNTYYNRYPTLALQAPMSLPTSIERKFIHKHITRPFRREVWMMVPVSVRTHIWLYIEEDTAIYLGDGWYCWSDMYDVTLYNE